MNIHLSQDIHKPMYVNTRLKITLVVGFSFKVLFSFHLYVEEVSGIDGWMCFKMQKKFLYSKVELGE